MHSSELFNLAQQRGVIPQIEPMPNWQDRSIPNLWEALVCLESHVGDTNFQDVVALRDLLTVIKNQLGETTPYEINTDDPENLTDFPFAVGIFTVILRKKDLAGYLTNV